MAPNTLVGAMKVRGDVRETDKNESLDIKENNILNQYLHNELHISVAALS